MVRTMAGGTGIMFDDRMLGHDPGAGHPERPERLRVLHDRFRDAPGLARIGARLASADELARTLGKAMAEFRRQSSDIMDEFQQQMRVDEEAARRPKPPPAPPGDETPPSQA